MAPRKQEAMKPLTQHGFGSWAKTYGEYISGSAHLDECDKLAAEVERRWGAGRVRLLVPLELREKFDRQRYLLNQAIWHGGLEDVVLQARRMQAAWRAVDKAAREGGAEFLTPDVWETTLSDGTVLAMARTADDLFAYRPEGRKVVLWSLDEVARLIEAREFEQSVKRAFPGAVVERVRSIVDPLQSIPDGGDDLDEVPF